MQQYRFLLPITGLFTATLLIANTLSAKIFDFHGIVLDAGTIVFPLAYIFGDMLTEVYGYKTSRKVIWTGFASLILMLGCYEVARILPPADFWHGQAGFEQIFGAIPRIVLGSIIAYFCGEFVNSYIVAKMKIRQQGKHMGLRFIASTIFGQLIDTFVFMIIAFAGTMAFDELLSIFFSCWLIKTGWEIIALPFTLWLVRKIKHLESVDVYDYGTDFNPFRIAD